jgi:hypothetical protein
MGLSPVQEKEMIDLKKAKYLTYLHDGRPCVYFKKVRNSMSLIEILFPEDGSIIAVDRLSLKPRSP